MACDGDRCPGELTECEREQGWRSGWLAQVARLSPMTVALVPIACFGVVGLLYLVLPDPVDFTGHASWITGSRGPERLE